MIAIKSLVQLVELHKMVDIKLSIAIPCGTPYVPVDFMMSLLAMEKPVIHSHDFIMGIVIDHARNKLVENAIESGCTHILFLDSDMTFPKDLIEKLLKQDKDIVGGMYVNRHVQTTIVAYQLGKNGLYRNITYDKPKGLVEVDGIGTGALLIKIDVFKNLPKPWFKFALHKPSGNTISEDLMFCKLAKSNGYKIYCDTNCNCGHLTLNNLMVHLEDNKMSEENKVEEVKEEEVVEEVKEEEKKEVVKEEVEAEAEATEE